MATQTSNTTAPHQMIVNEGNEVGDSVTVAMNTVEKATEAEINRLSSDFEKGEMKSELQILRQTVCDLEDSLSHANSEIVALKNEQLRLQLLDTKKTRDIKELERWNKQLKKKADELDKETLLIKLHAAELHDKIYSSESTVKPNKELLLRQFEINESLKNFRAFQFKTDLGMDKAKGTNGKAPKLQQMFSLVTMKPSQRHDSLSFDEIELD